jgi:hypothetical protein
MRTRRELIAAVAAGYALGAPASALGGDPPTKSDRQIVRDLVAIELLLIAVYHHVIATGLLSRRVERITRRVLAQERMHAAALRRELRRLGASSPASITRLEEIDRALLALKVSGQLERLRDEHDCVHLLLDLETAAEGAYFQAISQLQSVQLARLCAEILACEAQHQSAVSEARRPGNAWQAAPTAFVKGKS